LLTLINNSVVGSAVRELRNVEVELRQEGRSRGSDVVQESKGNVRSVSLDVDELSFQIGVFSVNGVLRGRVEFNSLEIGSIKSVSVGRNKDKLSSGVNNLNAIGNVDVGGETSSSGVDSSSGSEVNVDGWLLSIGSVTSAESVSGGQERPSASSSTSPGGSGERIDGNLNQSASGGTSRRSSSSIITLLRFVSDSITTRGIATVVSASVGFPVGVSESKIALLSSFEDTISTDRGGGSARSLDGTVVGVLAGTSSVSESVFGMSEFRVLEVRHVKGIFQDNPFDVLSARGGSLRSRIFVNGGRGKSSEEIEVQSVSEFSLSAVVRNTEERASEVISIRVKSTIITLLSVGGIDNTITTVGKSAVLSASVSSGIGILGITVITLLKLIEDTITTAWEFAVGSASISGVGVVDTPIAFLTSASFEVSVTTFKSARGITSITSDVVSIIASFTRVNGSITTFRENTGGSASILDRVAVGSSVIASLTRVNNAITTSRLLAVISASVSAVGVVASVIALNGRGINGSKTRTTSLLAGRSTVQVSNGSAWSRGNVDGVTLLSGIQINNTITTVSEDTSGSADSIRNPWVGSSEIALFASLDNTITTVQSTGGWASTVGAIGRTIITLFVVIGSVITTSSSNATISALAGSNTIGPLDTKSNGSITSFIVGRISDIITTSEVQTVSSARVGGSIAVVGSVVALFEVILQVQFTITTFEFADGWAAIEVVSISIITILTGVEDTITTSGKAASDSAGVGSVSVGGSVVTGFTPVDDSITTFRLLAVVSAAVGWSGRSRSIAVHGNSVIAFLSNSDGGGKDFVSGVIFKSTISAGTVRELGQVINDLLQELIGDGSSSRSLEENGEVQVGLSISGSVSNDVQVVEVNTLEGNLEFEIVSLSVDDVFGRRVEGKLIEMISLSVPHNWELLNVSRRSSSEEVSGVEEVGVLQSSRQNSFERAGVNGAGRSVDGRIDVDGRLFGSGAGGPARALGSPLLLLVVAPGSRTSSRGLGASMSRASRD
jgi:hypothetical protein